MADLVVIVPSRGRPEPVRELLKAIRETRVMHTQVLLSLDADDPKLDQYPDIWKVVGNQNHCMVDALNLAADHVISGLAGDSATAIGFFGDDHRPRTHGWDKAYLDALAEMGSGIVYGNDLLQGENLPTQCAMTQDVVRALGWMSPPELRHLFVDNCWKIIGNGADCLRYLPDVIVEHIHPVAGKAEWDEGHLRVNSTAMYEKDNAAFVEWLRTSMVEDVAKVRALRGGR